MTVRCAMFGWSVRWTSSSRLATVRLKPGASGLNRGRSSVDDEPKARCRRFVDDWAESRPARTRPSRRIAGGMAFIRVIPPRKLTQPKRDALHHDIVCGAFQNCSAGELDSWSV